MKTSPKFKQTVAMFIVIWLIIVAIFVHNLNNRVDPLEENEIQEYYDCVNSGRTSEYCLFKG